MNNNNVIIYQDENGITKVSVRFSNEDIWVTQQQLAEIYDTTQQNISQHIDGIYKDGELMLEATNKKFLLVRTEGTKRAKRNIDHYIDIIIAMDTVCNLKLPPVSAAGQQNGYMSISKKASHWMMTD